MGTALAVFIVANIIPGIYVSDFYVAILVSLVLGFINLLIRPVLLILTLPINIITLGLFSFVTNALLFWFVAFLIKGFEIDGFLPALVGSLFVSAISFLLHRPLVNTDK
jgi:putative membrane protein